MNTRELPQAGNFNRSNGIGITNLKRRLELLYNNKYQLTTNVEDTFYETHLNIDLG
jgi:sensor histidine kinase YesM